MIKIQSTLPATGNAYILFGFEAIQARPNLDPYSSTLRMNDETGQVFTSDVHIKHHVRRGLKAYAAAENLPHAAETVFYEKEDEAGNPCNFDLRLKKIREAAGISKPDMKDALNNTLDLPLFGYVHAIKGENFNVTNAANTLFRPVTFHDCEIYSLGRNNAFPTLDKQNKVNLHDMTGCGVALIFTDVYLAEIKRGRNADYFEQFLGRLEFPVEIPQKPRRDEVRQVLTAFFADGVSEELVSYALGVATARDGKLRTLFKDLFRAEELAKNDGRKITADDFKLFVKWRKSAGAWPEDR